MLIYYDMINRWYFNN